MIHPYFSGMKLLVEVKENKAAFVLELLGSLSFVKAKPVNVEKDRLLAELDEAVEEMKLIRAGKKKARKASEFLNEL